MNSNFAPPPSATQSSSPASRHPKMGRPSRYSDETVGQLCDLVQQRGVSDSAAAKELDIPRSTLSRWKREHPALEGLLAAARARHRRMRVTAYFQMQPAEASLDWRAAARELGRARPRDCGTPAVRSGTFVTTEDHR